MVSLGYDLVAVELVTEGTGRVLRVTLDGPDGVGIHDCTRVTHQVSPLLDADDPIQGRYRLEVSSPGMERPLQRPEDYERFVGYRARIRLAPGFPRRRYTGTLKGLDEHELLIEVDGAEHRLPFDDIERARLELTLEEYEALAPPTVTAEESEDSDDQ